MDTDSSAIFGVWSNPHNKEYIHNLLVFALTIFLIFLTLAIIFGLYGGHFSYGFYIWLFLAVFGTSLLLGGLILNELLLRPKRIEIQPAGILLISQWGSKRFIPWIQIKSFSTSLYSGNPERYYSQKEAKLTIIGHYFPINICLDIAERLKVAHKTMTGRDLRTLYDD